MKFSIVTAVFNREKTIGQAMACLQRQTYGNFEHIIVDGKSSDGTVAAAQMLADSRTRIISERDTGIYDAINKGIAAATGDVVGLLHSDDMLAHDRVLEQVAARFGRGDCDGVYGDLEYVDAENVERVVRLWRAGEFTSSRLRWGWMPPHPTVFLGRAIIAKHGNYDDDYRIAADYEAMLRYFGDSDLRWGYLPEVLVKMRLGGASNGSVRKVIAKSIEDYRSIRRHRVGGAFTLAMKNFSKISQFYLR